MISNRRILVPNSVALVLWAREPGWQAGPLIAGGGKTLVLHAAFDDVDGDGKEDEPITVKGRKDVDDGTGAGDVGGGGDGFYPGGTGDMGGGPILAPPSQKVADHPQDCGTDDGAAVQVAKQVMGTAPGSGPPNPMTAGGADWQHVEYGAVIVRNANGTYGALNDAIYSNGDFGFVNLPGAAGTDAVGFWHNHTTRTDNPGQQLVDRYPSSYADGSGDWDALQRLHDAVASGDPNFDPSIWITGPDGVTREFKLSERSYYEALTEEQMKAGEGLAGKERTQSCG